MMAKSTYEGHIPLTRAKSKKSFRLGYDLRTQLELKTMLWPAIILIAIFDFVPMYGLLMAFKAYDPLTVAKAFLRVNGTSSRTFMGIFRNFEFWPMVKYARNQSLWVTDRDPGNPDVRSVDE